MSEESKLLKDILYEPADDIYLGFYMSAPLVADIEDHTSVLVFY